MSNKKHNSNNPVRLYGRSYPLGASFYDGGVNFSLYSKNARQVELFFFDDVDDLFINSSDNCHNSNQIIRVSALSKFNQYY